jgi:uncharacterized Ntn-hydrolase superfamily protein
MAILPISTFSVVARDPRDGALGVAVASRHFDIGSRVSWAEAGVGAVATQAFIDPGYGPRALSRMSKGEGAADTLASLLAEDEQREIRQVAIVDAAGRTAAHTGALAVPHAEHRGGNGVSIQGNMLAREGVCEAMEAAFAGATGELAERMVVALEAGEQAGGDLRGKQSASLLVVREVSSEEPWRNVVVDLRVEDDAAPLTELRRLWRMQRAKSALDRAEAALGAGRLDEARAAFEEGLELSGREDEQLFWGGLAMSRVGDEQTAVSLLQEAIAKNPSWRTMLERLPAPLRPPPRVLSLLES